jgi:glutamine transport system permease protein
MPSIPEARSRTRLRIVDVIAAIIVTVGIVGYILDTLALRWGLSFAYIGKSYPNYLKAAWITVYVTTISYFIGMGIGFVLGWARSVRTASLAKVIAARRREATAMADGALVRGWFVGTWLRYGLKYYVRRSADAYVAIIRGTPLFVQIVFVWSAVIVFYPRMDPLFQGLLSGIIALTANTGGYQSEIFRAGIQTVHSGQVEAARAIGLSRWGTMRHIVLPQAVRLVIPPLTNEYIGLLKASSLLAVVGSVPELTTFGRNEAFVTFHIFEAFALVVGIYLLVTVPVSKVIERIERRYRVPGLGIQAPRTARV